MWMRTLNFVGYQALWFALVIGAARGTTGLAITAAVLFIAIQIACGSERLSDLRRLIVALVLGTFVDGVPSLLGWWQYATPWPALPPGGAPLWILALWACFSTTISRSLQFVQGAPWLGALLGAVGGPLAYLAAAHGWQAVHFDVEPVIYIAWLAAAWAIAIPLLARRSC
ncbi:DUF2878 domain-containing protein [Luteibacter aegosomatissinici]|uniref:DUF2878 domain-containing protein n=1 Tax=Luteibacter aegosomatissinici TaxID=2911539 RepID=UPI001FF7C91A|nr:DUF2878 domain-containing protein [Luteibacter aegosomatissinici]UPG96611.1 DUF2878 domain-containing protein [Luteibacter aegosomatissinici]